MYGFSSQAVWMATPKPPGQRRRRNAGQGQWQELPAGGRKGEIPEPRTDRVLGPIAKRYWDTLWTSPMAITYIDAEEELDPVDLEEHPEVRQRMWEQWHRPG
jgi:hypothetical protein